MEEFKDTELGKCIIKRNALQRKVVRLQKKNQLLQNNYDFQGIALERLKQITKELQKTIERVLRNQQ